MKEIVLWMMSTVTITVLLFGYHHSTSSSTAATQAGMTSLAAPATTGLSSGSGTTVTGTATNTRYGPVQVELTTSGGTITAVAVPEYPNSGGTDQQINARALPILVSETLKARSAHIDMVSGATYTSNGCQTSLQSALDKAGL